MIKIHRATQKDSEVLALLGRITYLESHGHYVKDKNDLNLYINSAFAVSNIKQEINDEKNFIYFITVDDLPVGYLKLIANIENTFVKTEKNCLLDKIYILEEFIPMKLGHQLLVFGEEKVREFQLETLWLKVYIENERAIKFYKKNAYQHIDNTVFLVNGVPYENFVLAKSIEV